MKTHEPITKMNHPKKTSKKKRYTHPVINEFGTIQDITKGGLGKQEEDWGGSWGT